jgi:hypothetical protein
VEVEMPVHDWSRVDDGIFHDFHVAWISELRRALNRGLLPPDYYALAEQIAGNLGPDVLTLQAPKGNGTGGPPGEVKGALSVLVAPPKVQTMLRAEDHDYTLRRRSLVIRHRSNHRIVALVELLSPGNKASRHAFQTFLDKVVAALAQGIHLLLIDLHPPTPRDPHGLPAAVWEQLTGEGYKQPADKPLSLASYPAGPAKTAYVQPIAVGDVLPDMPLFLTAEDYVNVPLEQTYQAAYEGEPRFYRDQLEG